MICPNDSSKIIEEDYPESVFLERKTLKEIEEAYQVKYSLLERCVANVFGTLNCLSFRITGEPEPDVQDELDGINIDTEYFRDKCLEGLARKKEARKEKASQEQPILLRDYLRAGLDSLAFKFETGLRVIVDPKILYNLPSKQYSQFVREAKEARLQREEASRRFLEFDFKPY